MNRLAALLMIVLLSFALLQGCQHIALKEGAVMVDVFTQANVDGYPYIRIPAIVMSKEGTLLAFAEGRQGGDHSENDIILKRSYDFGKTWSSVKVVAESGGDSLNDPLPVVLDTGRILMMYQRFPEKYHTIDMPKHDIKQAEIGYGGPRNVQNLLVYSDDDGTTWSAPRDITRQVRREGVLAAGSPGVGIQLQFGAHKGRVLFPLYENIPNDTERQRGWRNSVAISDDHGATWRYSAWVPVAGLKGYGNEAQIAELPNGAIVLHARNQWGDSHRVGAISHDGGETWENMTPIPDLVTPACMGSVIRQDHPNGKDYRLLAAIPNTTSKRRNGTVFASYDGGKTWPQKQVIYQQGYAYSCLIALPDGLIGCLFERDGCVYNTFTTLELPWVK